MKRQIKSIIGKAGLDIRRLSGAPFGVSWKHDVRSLLRPGGKPTIFDIGANVGQTAENLALVFPDSKIYSFEPVPSAFAELRRNTARLAQVECINMALGEKPGEALITSDRGLRNTLLPGVSSHDHAVAHVGTVDDFCADRGIERVDLLKIDTEGFETFVLKGASETLARGTVDFVVTACAFTRRPDEPHGDFFEIYAMLAPLGFTMVSFYTGGVDELGWIWGDVLMMREGAAAGLQVMRSRISPVRH